MPKKNNLGSAWDNCNNTPDLAEVYLGQAINDDETFINILTNPAWSISPNSLGVQTGLAMGSLDVVNAIFNQFDNEQFSLLYDVLFSKAVSITQERQNLFVEILGEYEQQVLSSKTALTRSIKANIEQIFPASIFNLSTKFEKISAISPENICKWLMSKEIHNGYTISFITTAIEGAYLAPYAILIMAVKYLRMDIIEFLLSDTVEDFDVIDSEVFTQWDTAMVSLETSASCTTNKHINGIKVGLRLNMFSFPVDGVKDVEKRMKARKSMLPFVTYRNALFSPDDGE